MILHLLVAAVLFFTNCDRKDRQQFQVQQAGFSANAVKPEQGYDTSAYAMHPRFQGYAGDTATPLNNLRAQLDALLSQPSMRGVTVSSKVVFYEPNGQVHEIFEKNPSVSVLPASVEKMFTSSSTLWALGSHYAFATKLDMPPATRVEGNRVIGPVYLRPSGDPTFRSSDFDVLARQLREKGITQIQGDIISDLAGEDALTPEAKEYFASQHEASSGSLRSRDSVTDASDLGDNGLSQGASDQEASDEDEVEDVGVLSSNPNFAIDRNVISVTVTAGATKGAPLTVRVNPPLSFVRISNGGSTSAPAPIIKRKIGKGKKARTVTTRGRAVSTLRVSSSGNPSEMMQIVSISGQLPARTVRTYSFAIKNVPLAMAAVLKWRLEQNGISVLGQPGTGQIGMPAAQLRTLASKETPLMDLLMQMNKRSDNYLAESMFRKLSTIATVAATAPDERARKLMKSWLQVCNVDGTQCTFIDGSGLSKANRTTANTVIDLLTAIRQQGMFELFTKTLSIAGLDGTLRHRMIGTPAQFNAHGKTGTLNGVTALAGYVITGDGQLASYFITMQKFRGGPYAYKRIQDAIVTNLASFRYDVYTSPTGDLQNNIDSLLQAMDSASVEGNYAGAESEQ